MWKGEASTRRSAGRTHRLPRPEELARRGRRGDEGGGEQREGDERRQARTGGATAERCHRALTPVRTVTGILVDALRFVIVSMLASRRVGERERERREWAGVVVVGYGGVGEICAEDHRGGIRSKRFCSARLCLGGYLLRFGWLHGIRPPRRCDGVGYCPLLEYRIPAWTASRVTQASCCVKPNVHEHRGSSIVVQSPKARPLGPHDCPRWLSN